jgi:ABC-type spermidine/putrescine transport system permease subunit II
LTLLLLAVESVTWIKVQKPTFDLVGVVLSSFGIAGICAAVALAFGILLGIAFILRGRRAPPASWADDGLHLLNR